MNATIALLGRNYEPALVNIGNGKQQLMTDVRNSDRCIIDDPEFAQLVWGRLKDRVEMIERDYSHEDFQTMALHKMLVKKPSDGKLWKAYGVNERFRYLKYSDADNHYFKPHMDGSYNHSSTQQSFFATVMLYLNDTKEGSGCTTFYRPNNDHQHEEVEYHVQPQAGSALVFQHNVRHAGAPVLPGKDGKSASLDPPRPKNLNKK